MSVKHLRGKRRESLREEGLGRVAKVAAEPSLLGRIGLPSAQRDAGYRSEGSLSSDNLGGGFVRSLAWVLKESKYAPVRTLPLERTRWMLFVKHHRLGLGDAKVGTAAQKCAAHRTR